VPAPPLVTSQVSERDRKSQLREVLWALGAGALAVAALYPALLAGAAAHYVGVPHVPYLALGAGAWVAFAAAGAVGLAVPFGLPLTRANMRRAIIVVAAGAVAAAVAEAGVASWAYLKFGRVEPELLGVSLLLPLPIALLSAATAAWLLTRAPARRLAAGGVAVSGAIFGVMALLDTRGLADGLEEWSWPLAVSYAAAGAFVASVVVVVAAERRRVARAGGSG
jgi:hypothetical protein